MTIPAQHPPEPQATGPVPQPARMLNAIRLMYAGALLSVVLGLSLGLTGAGRAVPGGVADPGAYRAGVIFGSMLEGLAACGLWLWIAWASKRGHSWARIVSTVFFGLLSLYAAAGVAFLPAAAEAAAGLEWAAGLTALVLMWRSPSSAARRRRAG